MKNNEEVFKHLKIEEIFKYHTEVLGSNNADILVLVGMQGTAKTSAMKYDFARQDNALWIKQSWKKLEDDYKMARKDNPAKDLHIIHSLETLCNTYLDAFENEDWMTIEEVKKYRTLGVNGDRIHKFICEDDGCPYPIRSKEIAGLTFATFKALQIRLQHIDQNYKLLGQTKRIHIDEADGLLMPEVVEFSDYTIFENLMRLNTKRLPTDEAFVTLYKFEDFMDIKKALSKEFNSLTQNEVSIRNNRKRISELNKALKVLSRKFFLEIDQNKKTITMAPDIVDLILYVLKNDVKLILASATLRHNLVQRITIEEYFFALRYETELRALDRDYPSDYVENKMLEFVGSPNPIYYTQVYNYSDSSHSFSRRRYEVLKSKRSKLNNDRKKEFDDRLYEVEINTKLALRTLKELYNIEFGKPAFISHREINDRIRDLQEKYSGEKYGKFLADTFECYDFFSNAMHGSNLHEKHDGIVIYGDPLSPDITKLAGNLNLIADRRNMRTGFKLKEDAKIKQKRFVIESELSELLESIHRSRGKIPVVVIGNFLEPAKPDIKDSDAIDKDIIEDILNEDNIQIHYLIREYNKDKLNKRLKRLEEELGLILEDQKVKE